MLANLSLIFPYIAVLLEFNESRGTGPYTSLSMMTTRDTMTAGIPETQTFNKGLTLTVSKIVV